jgi:hypothetical protein
LIDLAHPTDAELGDDVVDAEPSAWLERQARVSGLYPSGSHLPASSGTGFGIGSGFRIGSQ